MLIGITGNIWSGKDTVAKMIQFYFGQKSSTEYFNSLGIEKFLKYYETSEYNSVCSACENYFEIKKFAGKLKQIAALLIGCKPEDFESQ
jgi:uridine kinase